jgi:hypothetical protein
MKQSPTTQKQEKLTVESSYNSAKLRVLRLLAERGWQTPKEVAQRAFSFRSYRNAWTTLLRLYRWGLVMRRSQPWGLEYSITDKGKTRLQWLLSRE